MWLNDKPSLYFPPRGGNSTKLALSSDVLGHLFPQRTCAFTPSNIIKLNEMPPLHQINETLFFLCDPAENKHSWFYTRVVFSLLVLACPTSAHFRTRMPV